MPILYADIIVDISHGDLDRVFQYLIPEELVEVIDIGVQVEIPFGKGNRLIRGYVVNITDKPSIAVDLIKPVSNILNEGIVIESQLIKLAWWIKEQYGSTMINALKTVIPINQKVKSKQKKYIKLIISKSEALDVLDEFRKKNNVARVRLLEELIEDDILPSDIVNNKLNISSQTINALEKMSIIEVLVEEVYRNPITLKETSRYSIELTEGQHKIVNEIIQEYNNKQHRPYLLHGITGSGKTEVYIELIANIINQGKQAIVLIPEIALTYQTVKRFYKRFGEQISVLHSRLSQGERYDQYLRAKRGEISIMIGPRSALFTPFNNLGIIIIDEEHEMTYKSETTPKYHARETAIKRAQMCDALVVLGSATPSMEAYTKALNNEYKLCELDKRINNQGLPEVSVVDLREELKSGNRTILSNKLRELIIDRLQKKQQIMLFINRRGYASFVSCRSCGYVVKCKHCDISYTYHNSGRLICHYCGSETSMPKTCPDCGSKYIKEFGTGTQKVEEYISKEFPQSRVLRMDMDTTSKKDSYEKILSTFSDGEADILVGTQMIVKGHDFPNVTLVGVLAADLSLYSNDYRSSERTFQLLTQVAGRAGRGDIKGEVVVQTYNPEHYSIQLAKVQDYKEFYNEEIQYRKLLKYPPASNILVIFIASKQERIGIEASSLLYDAVGITFENENLEIIGPTSATIGKINDIYRRVIYVKHDDYNYLREIKDYLEGYIDYSDKFNNVMIQFDFNPLITY